LLVFQSTLSYSLSYKIITIVISVGQLQNDLCHFSHKSYVVPPDLIAQMITNLTAWWYKCQFCAILFSLCIATSYNKFTRWTSTPPPILNCYPYHPIIHCGCGYSEETNFPTQGVGQPMIEVCILDQDFCLILILQGTDTNKQASTQQELTVVFLQIESTD